MRISSILSIAAIFALVAGGSTLMAVKAADLIEKRSKTEVADALLANDHAWASVHVDGLQVQLTGTAPDEATRFRALSVVNGIVDAERVIDHMDVADAAAIKAPDFSVEILRNSTGISLIGLIPAATDREELIESLKELDSEHEITDMLNSSEAEVPPGWDAALEFGIDVLRSLPKSKISIGADHVTVSALADSPEEKQQIEARLAKQVPKALTLSTRITAPRPVITPFTLRFIIDDQGVRFDACSADSPQSRAAIVKAAQQAGFAGEPDCTIGLGVPSPSWSKAVVTGIAALKKLGGGSITYSDADVTLVALEGTAQGQFDRISGELEADLPDLFSLHSVLPKTAKNGEAAEQEPIEFVATLSPESKVQLRGRLSNTREREAVYSYARARFGNEAVYGAARLDQDLPQGWPLRVLIGVQALAELSQGSVVVKSDVIEVRGITGKPEARANITRLLSDKLGSSQDYTIDVTYEKRLDPVASLLKPEQCVQQLNAVQKERKISFEPGSADLDAKGLAVIARLAEIIKTCAPLKLEISGHTDSQGRESMNKALSQSRADAVLQAFIAQKVLTSGMSAVGYGESTPIADNGTEEGREANRRIEFNLILPQPAQTPPAEQKPAEPSDTAQQDQPQQGQTPPPVPNVSQPPAQFPQNAPLPPPLQPAAGTGQATNAPAPQQPSSETQPAEANNEQN
ncbi:MAG: hypothetical protein CSA68_00085 [Rhodobacterales bacterium]|nr:MAG: hypothetical protein CSA68_00085 [Rhodobacterales bacterium]